MALKDKILKLVLCSKKPSNIPRDMERSEALSQLLNLDRETKRRIREDELRNSMKRYGPNTKLSTVIGSKEKEDYL